MISVLLCDDDVRFLEKLKAATEAFFAARGLPAKIMGFSDAGEIGAETLNTCDIALLDIDYGGQTDNGMDLARRLRKARKDAVIVFVTNYVEYAPEGYEVQAFRYLMKNEIDRKLQGCLGSALAHLRRESPVVCFTSGGERIPVKLEELVYAESLGHTVLVHLRGGRLLSIYSSLAAVEDELSQRGFLRIQKSYLVNMAHLRYLKCSEAALDEGGTLPVSEKNYADLKRKYLLWKGAV